MNNCEANHCIKCSVNSCKHHCPGEDFCSLDCVTIGSHESDPAMNQCTDCRSFENINPEEQRRAVAETLFGNE